MTHAWNHHGIRTLSMSSVTTQTTSSTSGSYSGSSWMHLMTLSGETYVFHIIVPFHRRSYNYPMQTNTRFEMAKAAIVSGLPPHATAEQREEHLGEFYKNWVLQEAARQEEYDSEWRRRSMQEIKLATRVSYQKLKARFTT